MAYLGLVPAEHSSGAKIRRRGITKAGNPRARRLLVESAWTYAEAPRVGQEIQRRQEGVELEIVKIAWKAQLGCMIAIAGWRRRASRRTW